MIPSADVATIVDLAVTGLVDLASGPAARFACVRTFLLLGLLGRDRLSVIPHQHLLGQRIPHRNAVQLRMDAHGLP
jgi:hypothetical protein